MEIKNQYGGYMCKTTYSEFRDHDEYYRRALAKNEGQEKADAYYKGVDEKRAATLAKYPFNLVVKGYYPEHDFAHRWVWEHIGPPTVEECQEQYSEYPGCPIVKATEEVVHGEHKGHKWTEKRYKNPEKHGHEGTWKYTWLGKTGYDYGYGEYCFEDETDRDHFAAVVESLGMGELYDDSDEAPVVSEGQGDGKAPDAQ